MAESSDRSVLIAGGGVAALEALLALRELTEGEADLTLLSPEPEFTYRPLLVREPFGPDVADRIDLRGALDQLGGRFVQGTLERIDAAQRRATLAEGEPLDFRFAAICVGARMRPALPSAHTLWIEQLPTRIERLLERVPNGGTLDMIVPAGVTWTLPIYEFALMTARRLEELGREDVRLLVLTPESAPLTIFGTEPSAAVERLLSSREIEVCTDTWVSEADGRLIARGGCTELEGVPVALPVLSGWEIDGLPTDREGFVPTDQHGRVRGLDDVFAAGDGTSFPIKQGGIATQQADAVAEAIAAELGADLDPRPFRPVLRGKLLTGEESLSLRAEVAGGAGEGMASSDYLWWPPHKVSGRYLAPWLAGESLHADLEPPARSVDVEVALPHEWHGEPAGLGLYGGAPRE